MSQLCIPMLALAPNFAPLSPPLSVPVPLSVSLPLCVCLSHWCPYFEVCVKVPGMSPHPAAYINCSGWPDLSKLFRAFLLLCEIKTVLLEWDDTLDEAQALSSQNLGLTWKQPGMRVRES